MGCKCSASVPSSLNNSTQHREKNTRPLLISPSTLVDRPTSVRTICIFSLDCLILYGNRNEQSLIAGIFSGQQAGNYRQGFLPGRSTDHLGKAASGALGKATKVQMPVLTDCSSLWQQFLWLIALFEMMRFIYFFCSVLISDNITFPMQFISPSRRNLPFCVIITVTAINPMCVIIVRTRFTMLYKYNLNCEEICLDRLIVGRAFRVG